jgi:hypothetical protein
VLLLPLSSFTFLVLALRVPELAVVSLGRMSLPCRQA